MRLSYVCTMNTLEALGFATGIAGVYLQLKERVWTFPVGLINVCISLVLFFEQRLYADALQQSVYIVLLSYGWWMWLKKDGAQHTLLHISTTTPGYGVRLAGTTFSFALLLGYILHRYTDAAFPWLDAAATSASFAAQWLVAKKKIENWLIWIPVNITYICIYMAKDLWLYSVLFGIYLLLAIWGYLEWKKSLQAIHA